MGTAKSQEMDTSSDGLKLFTKRGMTTETAQRAFHSVVVFLEGDRRRGFGVYSEIRYESVSLSITIFQRGNLGVDVV